VTPFTGIRPSGGAALTPPPHRLLGPEQRETTMTIPNVKHIVHGRPGQAPALHVVENEGHLTWWDLMSELDPDWLAWSDRLNEGRPPFVRVV